MAGVKWVNRIVALTEPFTGWVSTTYVNVSPFGSVVLVRTASQKGQRVGRTRSWMPASWRTRATNSAAFAASDEFHQSFVSTRTASAYDVMIDCTGALAAVLLCWMFAQARHAYETTRK